MLDLMKLSLWRPFSASFEQESSSQGFQFETLLYQFNDTLGWGLEEII